MAWNCCDRCRGEGEIPERDTLMGRMFGVWKTCPACGGDGHAKPPGWPDPKEIARLKPTPPPPASTEIVANWQRPFFLVARPRRTWGRAF